MLSSAYCLPFSSLFFIHFVFIPLPCFSSPPDRAILFVQCMCVCVCVCMCVCVYVCVYVCACACVWATRRQSIRRGQIKHSCLYCLFTNTNTPNRCTNTTRLEIFTPSCLLIGQVHTQMLSFLLGRKNSDFNVTMQSSLKSDYNLKTIHLVFTSCFNVAWLLLQFQKRPQLKRS